MLRHLRPARMSFASSMRPLSRAFGCACEAPWIPTPSSMLALPPSTGRSWTSAVRAPARADAIAAPMPVVPAPTTTTSKSPASDTVSGWPSSRRRSRARGSSASGGTYAASVVNSTASQRPNQPDLSTSRTSQGPTARSYAPARSQRQPGLPDAPRTGDSRPFTASANVPGECAGTQSFVRAHACHVPARGTSNDVDASFTGVPTAAARR